MVMSPKVLLHILIHGRRDEPLKTRVRIALRWARIAVLIVAGLVTLQSLLLVAGAWRDDIAITHNMGVAQAEVLSAGPRRSTIEFVTPERVTYRPELGVLYPSHLATGMRIYVEYNKNDPNLVRVQHRNAGLAIIPAGSLAVVGWLTSGSTVATHRRAPPAKVPDLQISHDVCPQATLSTADADTVVMCALPSSRNPSSPKSTVSATR
jgi:hypothetical protein